jgi:hypothetical protein
MKFEKEINAFAAFYHFISETMKKSKLIFIQVTDVILFRISLV